jgi:hypothetical protein
MEAVGGGWTARFYNVHCTVLYIVQDSKEARSGREHSGLGGTMVLLEAL